MVVRPDGMGETAESVSDVWEQSGHTSQEDIKESAGEEIEDPHVVSGVSTAGAHVSAAVDTAEMASKDFVVWLRSS